MSQSACPVVGPERDDARICGVPVGPVPSRTVTSETYKYMSMDGARAARRSAGASKGATASAQARRCPRCLRKAALSSPVIWPGEGRARKCNYCGHEVGILYGKTFGYDVTPEPGARA